MKDFRRKAPLLLALSLSVSATACNEQEACPKNTAKQKSAMLISTNAAPPVGQAVFQPGEYDLRPANEFDRSVSLALYDAATPTDSFYTPDAFFPYDGTPGNPFAYAWEALPEDILPDTPNNDYDSDAPSAVLPPVEQYDVSETWYDTDDIAPLFDLGAGSGNDLFSL